MRFTNVAWFVNVSMLSQGRECPSSPPAYICLDLFFYLRARVQRNVQTVAMRARF